MAMPTQGKKAEEPFSESRLQETKETGWTDGTDEWRGGKSKKEYELWVKTACLTT